MANSEHLAIIKQGAKLWNKWRLENPQIKPNLERAILNGINLEKANFSNTNLVLTQFKNAVLKNADFTDANIQNTNFYQARLQGAIFLRAIGGLRKESRLMLSIYYLFGLTVLFSLFIGAILYLSAAIFDSNNSNKIAGLITLFLIAFFLACTKYTKDIHGAKDLGIILLSTLSLSFLILSRYNNLAGAAGIIITTVGFIFIFFATTTLIVATSSILKNLGVFLLILFLIVFNYFTFNFFTRINIEGIPKPETSVSLTLSSVFIIGLFISLDLGKKIYNGEERYIWINYVVTYFIARVGTCFSESNLTDSTFELAYLENTDFQDAILSNVNWSKAKKLELIRTEKSYFKNKNIRKLLTERDFIEQKFSSDDYQNLRELNLSNKNFKNSTFVDIDFYKSNFKNSNLSGVKFTRVKLHDTNLDSVTLTGAIFEECNISYAKNIDRVICDYIEYQGDQYPHDGEFEQGEFAKIFTEAENTIKLIFRHGINWRAFAYTFNKSNIQIYNTKGEEIFLKEYKTSGDGLIVLTISIPDGVNQDKAKDDFIYQYELEIARLTGIVEAQDKIIAPFYERMLLPQTQVNLLNNPLSKMFKEDKLQVLQSIIQEDSHTDSKLSESLKMNIHKVRLILDELQISGFIKITKNKQYRDSTQPKIDSVLVTEVTSLGYLLLDGEISLEENSYSNQNLNFYSGNIGIANMNGGEIKDKVKIGGIINEKEDNNLTQLIEEIQNLLNILEQNNPSSTRREKFDIAEKAIKQIENDYNLTQRIISALENGLIGYLQALLVSPVTSFFIAALEEWQQTKTKK